ncbi:hypothetical protein E4O04_01760 [Treponema sp. OMZ 799]|uniref:hypothetical protein n=1 Tax=Treponema sp. OMZ 799 TaxID=2563668 RepID=UPI0020A545EF|nr:hypothetical protein [Treponema sp. OMZ 799]UTC76808.1 hypothetical protein E4O04_01760 [Treponema sp. OMZ 799]
MYKMIIKKEKKKIQKVLYDAVMNHSWKDKKCRILCILCNITLLLHGIMHIDSKEQNNQ